MLDRNARRMFVPLLLAAAALAVTATQGPVIAAPDDPALVDINTAPAEELEQLPGVGPSLALRIVEFREKNGPFTSVEELLKVRGIGEKSLERFRHLVTVGRAKKS